MSMILRLFSGGVRFEDESALLAFVRERAVPGALAIPGLLSFQPAVRRSPEGLELVLVTSWATFDSIVARGRDLDTPVAMPEATGLVVHGHSDHYELVLGDARGLPLATSTLVASRVPLQQGMEAVYFDAFREHAEGLLDGEGLVAFQLGRRSVGATTEALAVTVWAQDEPGAAPPDHGVVIGGSRLAACHAGSPITASYEALSVAPAKPGAPAILLADDERNYRYATPAAARLTGHSVARLLTMRIDDLTASEMRAQVPDVWRRFIEDGSMNAAFALARPDGSEVGVRFSARARSPWPGSHASMFVPAASPLEPDIDRALVDAGFVSRFVAAPHEGTDRAAAT